MEDLLWVEQGINIMRQIFRPSALVPDGFVVESAALDGAMGMIVVRPTSQASICPGCATTSARVRRRRPAFIADTDGASPICQSQADQFVC